MSPHIPDDVRRAILANEKITAVKLAMTAKTLGLAAAKSYVESIWDEVWSQSDDLSTLRFVVVTWSDGLALPGGFTAPGNKRLEAYLRVPADWLEGIRLSDTAMELVFRFVYGPSWRQGNEDGSQYVVFNAGSRLLGEGEIASKVWLSSYDVKSTRRWCLDGNSGTGLVEASGGQW